MKIRDFYRTGKYFFLSLVMLMSFNQFSIGQTCIEPDSLKGKDGISICYNEDGTANVTLYLKEGYSSDEYDGFSIFDINSSSIAEPPIGTIVKKHVAGSNIYVFENVPERVFVKKGIYVIFKLDQTPRCPPIGGTAGFKIDPANALKIDNIALTPNKHCEAPYNGTATVVVTGGLGTLEYSWTNSAGEEISTDKDLEGRNAGQYTLTVTDEYGCTQSETITITDEIAVVPVPSVLINPIGYCEGELILPLSPQNLLPNSEVTWYSDPEGNVFVSNDREFNPPISNTIEGIHQYYVKQKDILTGCESEMSAAIEIQVYLKPVLGGVNLNQEFCLGTDAQYGDLTLESPPPITNSTYNWYSTPTGGNPLTGAIGLGIKRLYLEEVASVDRGGCESNRVPVDVSVYEDIERELVVIVGDQMLCEGADKEFVLKAAEAGVSYTFYKGTPGETSIEFSTQNPTAVSDLTFSVKATQLEIGDNGFYWIAKRYHSVTGEELCSEVLMNQPLITVYAKPTLSLPVSVNKSSVCENEKVTLTIENTEVGNKYTIDNGATFVAGNGGTITIETDELFVLGNYTITVHVYNNGCTTRQPLDNSVSVLVKAAPLQKNVSVAPNQVCLNGTAQFALQNPEPSLNYILQKENGGTYVDVEVKVGDGGAFLNFTPQTITENSTYKIVADNESCQVDMGTPMAVTLFPETPVTIPATLSICPDKTTFIDSGIDPTISGDSFEWKNVTTELVVGTSSNLEITEAGSYQLKYTNENGCESVSNITIVSVGTPITPLLKVQGDASNAICQGESLTLEVDQGSSFRWLRNGVEHEVNTSTTLSVSIAGEYSVEITDAAGCYTVSNTVEVFVNQATLPADWASLIGAQEVCGGTTVSDFLPNMTDYSLNESNIDGTALASGYSLEEKKYYISYTDPINDCTSVREEVSISFTDGVDIRTSINLSSGGRGGNTLSVCLSDNYFLNIERAEAEVTYQFIDEENNIIDSYDNSADNFRPRIVFNKVGTVDGVFKFYLKVLKGGCEYYLLNTDGSGTKKELELTVLSPAENKSVVYDPTPVCDIFQLSFVVENADPDIVYQVYEVDGLNSEIVSAEFQLPDGTADPTNLLLTSDLLEYNNGADISKIYSVFAKNPSGECPLSNISEELPLTILGTPAMLTPPAVQSIPIVGGVLPTVANLNPGDNVTGTAVWFDENDQELSVTSQLHATGSKIYSLIHRSNAGCESDPVTVEVIVGIQPDAPLHPKDPVAAFRFCTTENKTVLNLRAEFIEGTHYDTGATLKFYFGGVEGIDSDVLQAGIYKVTQTVAGFESIALSVAVQIENETILKPVFDDYAQFVCTDDLSSTISATFVGHEEGSVQFELIPSSVGTLEVIGSSVTITWNRTAIAIQAATSASLVAKATDFCGNEESSDPVVFDIYKKMPVITSESNQGFCELSRISDLTYTLSRPLEVYETIQWFESATSNSPLAETFTLQNGENYFVAINNADCDLVSAKEEVSVQVFQNTLSLSIPDLEVTEIGSVLVPVNIVDGFDKIKTLQFGISYDASLLSIENENILTPINGLVATKVTDGSIQVQYTSLEPDGTDLVEASQLMLLEFQMLPDNCGEVLIEFDETVLATQVTYGAACMANTFTKSNGGVTSTKELSFELSSDAVEVCSGGEANFAVATENAGLNPTINWYVSRDGNTEEIQAVHTTTFVLQNITVETSVRVEVIPTETCIVNNENDPNTLLTVTLGNVTPTLQIASDQTEVCPSKTVLFTASGTNVGGAPVYVWEVSTNGGTYREAQNGTQNTLSLSTNEGEEYDVRARMITGQACSDESVGEGVVSNLLNLQVVKQDLNVVINGANSVCEASSDAITLIPTIEDIEETTLSYLWSINNGAQTFTTKVLAINESDLAVPVALTTDQFEVKLTVTSTDACFNALPEPVTFVITKTTALDFSVELNASETEICAGETVDFTTNLVESGTYIPSYVWYLNDVEIGGETEGRLSLSALANGDIVKVAVNLTTGGGTTCLLRTEASTIETITVNSAPNLTFLPTTSGCAPFDLTATVDVINSDVGNITFWTDAEATSELLNPANLTSSGTYYVKLETASASCNSVIETITITVNPAPNLVVQDIESVNCGDPVNLVNAIVGTPTGDEQFYEDVAGTVLVANPFNVTVSGTYYIKRSAGTCSEIKPVIVTIKEAVLASVVINSASTSCNTPNGRLEVGIDNLGGRDASQFRYSLTNIRTSITEDQLGNGEFTGLSADDYQATVTYVPSGCVSLVLSETIDGPTPLNLITSKTPTNGCGVATGTITLTLPDFVANDYVYTLNGGAEVAITSGVTTINNLPAKAYDLVVRKVSSGCEQNELITITAIDGIEVTDVTSNKESSCGLTDGDITVSIEGTFAPFTYQLVRPDGSESTPITKADKTHTFTGLVPGDYFVKVIDNNTCEGLDPIQVLPADDCEDFDCDNIRAIVSTNAASCSGINDGTIVVTLRGAINYEYQVVDAFNQIVFNGQFTAYDDRAWDILEIENVPEGSYDVFVRIKKDEPCEWEEPEKANIATVTKLNVSVEASPSVCGQTDGMIKVNLVGNPNEYDFNVTKVGEVAKRPAGDEVYLFNELEQGDYLVEVINKNSGCNYSENVKINGAPFTLPKGIVKIGRFNTVDKTTSNVGNGYLTIKKEGWAIEGHEYSYVLNYEGVKLVTGDFTNGLFLQMLDGNYSIVVRDKTSDCESEPFNFTFEKLKEGATFEITPITCGNSDGKIKVIPNQEDLAVELTIEDAAGNAVSLPEGELIFENLAEGTYTVRLTYTRYKNDPFVKEFVATDLVVGSPANCGGNTTCIEVDEVRVKNESCADGGTLGEITIASIANGKGPFHYTLYASDGTAVFPAGQQNSVFIDISAGNYYVIVQDLGKPFDCEVQSDIITIRRKGLINEVLVKNQTNPVCYSGEFASASFEIDGAGSYEYSIDVKGYREWTAFENKSYINDLPKGDYVVLFRSGNEDECPYSLSMSVQSEITEPLVIDWNVVKAASCDSNDGSFMLNEVSGGAGAPYTFRFKGVPMSSLPADRVITGLSSNIEIFTVIDSRDCEQNFEITVGGPGLVYFDMTTTEPTCAGNGRDGVISISIDNTKTLASPPYLVTITQGEDVFYLQEPMTTLSRAFTGFAQGKYEVLVSVEDSDIACPNQQEVEVTGGKTFVDFEMELINPPCIDDELVIQILNIQGEESIPYQFKLTDNESRKVVVSEMFDPTGEVIAFEYINDTLKTGSYKLEIIQNQLNCTIKGEKEIDIVRSKRMLAINEIVVDELPFDYEGGNYGRVLLKSIDRSGQGDYEVDLEPISVWGEYENEIPKHEYVLGQSRDGSRSFEQDFDSLYSGMYIITLSDGAGCSVDEEFQLEKNIEIWIPNLFTPNGDRWNKDFYIRNMPEEPNSGWKMKIMDRNGKIVFESTDYWIENTWKGEEENEGVYFYYLDTGKEKFNGWIELRRGNVQLGE